MSDLSGPVPTPRYLSIVGASFEVSRAMGHSYVGVGTALRSRIIARKRCSTPT